MKVNCLEKENVEFENKIGRLLNDSSSQHQTKKSTVKILKFGTPQTIAIIVLKLVKFDVTLH